MTEQPTDIESRDSQPSQSFWSRPTVKWTITLLLGALFVLAFLTYLATDLVSNKLLDPQLYTNALEENHIYHRVYTDLLADPDMEELAAQLLGNIGLEDLADSVYSLAVSTLYLVLPPDTIQTATEGVIVKVTSYLKGDTDQLESRLDLSSDLDEEALAERITVALQVMITELIVQSVPSGGATSSAPDVEALSDYAQALSRGELPDIPAGALASSLEGLTEAEREEVVDALLGPVEDEISPFMRLQVEAAVAANDMPSALTTASRFLLQDQVSEAAAQLADEFASAETYDALAATAICGSRLRFSARPAFDPVGDPGYGHNPGPDRLDPQRQYRRGAPLGGGDFPGGGWAGSPVVDRREGVFARRVARTLRGQPGDDSSFLGQHDPRCGGFADD
jgi:hypothetical protein